MLILLIKICFIFRFYQLFEFFLLLLSWFTLFNYNLFNPFSLYTDFIQIHIFFNRNSITSYTQQHINDYIYLESFLIEKSYTPMISLLIHSFILTFSRLVYRYFMPRYLWIAYIVRLYLHNFKLFHESFFTKII